MAQQTIGKIPDFTSDDNQSPEVVVEAVQPAEAPVEETVVTETETPVPSTEKPVEEVHVAPSNPDIEKEARAVQALQEVRAELLKDIAGLRGQRREIKQDEINKVDKQLDDLKDLHPDDVSVIDRVLRNKGYVTKDQANQMFYDAVKNEELSKFLDKYPELKPENDPSDQRWNALQKELAFFRMPEDPHHIPQVLERAYRGMTPKVVTDPIAPKRRQIAVAGAGAGGVQKTSAPINAFDPSRRAMLEQGGFSEEDIKSMEARRQ